LDIRGTALTGKFAEYERALKSIEGLLPKTLNNGQEYKKRLTGHYTGFKCYNDSVSFKIYDKREQIIEEHNYNIGSELLRLEYRFLSDDKIKNVLGHNEVEKLIQDFGQVERTFRTRLEKDLINKINDDIKKQIKRTVKTLQDYKTKYKSKYIGQAVGALGENSLLDYEILKKAFEIAEEGKNKNTLKNNLTLIKRKLMEK
jgi:hypothetical protein